MKGEGCMNITDVRVRRVAKEGKMKAVVSITIDEEFVVHDIKVIEGEKGLFIAMPSRKAADGEYRDIAHPITPAARRQLEDAILAVYHREKAEAEQMQRLPYGDYFAEHFAASPASAPAAAVTPPLGNTGG